MTQEWDDILSEQIAQLQPDLPAAQGGWRAVRSIDEVSPRPQQPPLTLPEPDGMLSVRLPVQPEEASPVGAPPPPSLTSQLSLTWAPRRRARRRVTEEELPDEVWPAWEPPQREEMASTPPAPAPLSWLRPLRSLVRLFLPQTKGQQAVPERPHVPPPREVIPVSPVPQADVHETADDPVLRQRALRPVPENLPAVPLTLAQWPIATPASEAPEDSMPVAKAEAVAREQPGLGPERAVSVPPPRSESVLRRWLNPLRSETARPETSQPREPEVQEERESVKAFPEVEIVDRREKAAAEPPSAERQYPPAEVARERTTREQDEGEPLSPVLRERMEQLLDVPLKEVRVFRNSIAQQATRARGADALAIGSEVHVAREQGNPSSPAGQALMAHELSHVAARIAGSNEPAHQEERRAQAIEHSVRSTPELAIRPQPAKLGPPLEHRAQPRSAIAPTASSLQAAASYSGAGFAGGPSAGTTGSSTAVHAAPMGRIPAIADSALGVGAAGVGMQSDAANAGNDQNEPERDEPGGVDRIVEAVMRRLRREGSFERERRGSFRSEIGG